MLLVSHNANECYMFTKDRPSRISNFVGYAIPNQTLSERFSVDSFVTILARLDNLRVRRLLSLGIWGSLPDKIHRLSSLEYLDLSSNYLYGSLPQQISRMVGLKTLVLDDNSFNASVPDWLGSLSNLTKLSLVNNQLKGRLPSSIGRIRNLTSLVLSNNKISGEFPDLNGLKSLTVLDLAGNKLKSMLPTRIFSLPNISSVNLASNMLSGSLPYHMECAQKLSIVDISNNGLTGGLPHCLSKMFAKFFGSYLTIHVSHQHPGSYCTGSARKKSQNSKSTGLIVLVSIVEGVVLVLAPLDFLLLLISRIYCTGGSSEHHLLQKQVQENTVTGLTSQLMANARFISQLMACKASQYDMYFPLKC